MTTKQFTIDSGWRQVIIAFIWLAASLATL
jgi:hypothetical protein